MTAETAVITALLPRAIPSALTSNPLMGSCGMPTDKMLDKVDPSAANTHVYDMDAKFASTVREVRTLIANRA